MVRTFTKEQLYKALNAALLDLGLMGKTMEECGAANAALGKELRRVFTEVSKTNKITPQQLKVLRDNNEFQRLSQMLQKSVNESNNLRDELRQIKNEIGTIQDTASRALEENKRLQAELTRGQATRAQALLKEVLKKLKESVKLDEIIGEFNKILNIEKNINKRQITETNQDIIAAYDAIKRQNEGSLTEGASIDKQPPAFQGLFNAIVKKVINFPALTQGIRIIDKAQIELQNVLRSIESNLQALEGTSAIIQKGGKRRIDRKTRKQKKNRSTRKSQKTRKWQRK